MELKNLMKHFPELRRALRNMHYELTENGAVFLPKQKLTLGGCFVHDVNGQDYQVDPNLIVNEGLNDVLDVYLHNQAQIATWYVAPFTGNVTPLATWTAANYTSNSTELTAYDEATRVAFVEAAAASQSISNLASKAAFTINATVTVYGAALISASAKSATTGKLFAATRFATSRNLVDDDILNIGYTISASST